MKYYLTLSSAVFFWDSPSRALFYDGASYRSLLVQKTSPELTVFCESLTDKNNLHSICLEEADISVDVAKVIQELIQRRMARKVRDVRDCSLPPVLQLNGDLDYMSDSEKESHINRICSYTFLNKITLFVNPSQTCEKYKELLDDIARRIRPHNPAFVYEIVDYDTFLGVQALLAEDYRNGKLSVSEEDILGAEISKRVIFIHQKINVNYWGQLFVFPDGKVYPSPIKEPTHCLGHISEPILPMIVKELRENHAWRRVRDNVLCNNCVFRWLCPSPTPFETLYDIPVVCKRP